MRARRHRGIGEGYFFPAKDLTSSDAEHPTMKSGGHLSDQTFWAPVLHRSQDVVTSTTENDEDDAIEASLLPSYSPFRLFSLPGAARGVSLFDARLS